MHHFGPQGPIPKEGESTVAAFEGEETSAEVYSSSGPFDAKVKEMGSLFQTQGKESFDI